MNDLMIGGDLCLFGTVGDDWWGDGFTAADVVRALSQLSGDVLVRVNSGGGSAFEGSAIYSALKAHDGRITVRVEGIAASAASLIAMAGDEIIMPLGATMMIHDPSGFTMGTAKDHEKTAEALHKLADVYAEVYADRSGKDADAVRALMVEETWFGPSDAVAEGFATSAAEDDEAETVAAFPYHIFAKAPQQLCALATDRGWVLRPSPAAIAASLSKEGAMPKDQTTTAAPPKDPATVTAPPAEMSAEDRKIIEMAKRRTVVAKHYGDKLTAEQVDTIVAEADTDADAVAAAAKVATDAMIKAAGPETRPTAQITGDEGERKVEAMIGALGHSLFGTRLEGPATEYRGLTMKKLAIELSGKRTYADNDHDLVKSGMRARGVLMSGAAHSTSDFTYLTAEVVNRQIRADYEARPGNWRRISNRRTASDFRTLYSVQAGVDTEMRKVNEDGEYESTVLSDEGESYRVERFGRKVLLTFEAIVNDDLSAFARLPGRFTRGALNLESRIVWGLISANANMSDGTALFANVAKRGRNLAASGSVISAASVGAGRKVMWEQRPLGAKEAGDDFISAMADTIAVPPALEEAVLKFASPTVPTTDAEGNPYKGTLEPLVSPHLGAAITGGSDTAWYLFDSTLPPIEHAFLQGYETPTVEPIEEADPKGVTMIAEHIFGAGAVEFRGSYKNPGQ